MEEKRVQNIEMHPPIEACQNCPMQEINIARAETKLPRWVASAGRLRWTLTSEDNGGVIAYVDEDCSSF